MKTWSALMLVCGMCWATQMLALSGAGPGTMVSAIFPEPTAHAASQKQPTEAGASVERGRYLAEHVAMCVECHSGRDARGEIVAAERYMGGPIPPGPSWATDWAIRAPRNKGLPGYSDDDALRLLTRGAINREGRQLRPPMPRFRMTEQDAADITAFLKSLP